jgi:gliding motility-associated-like protein
VRFPLRATLGAAIGLAGLLLPFVGPLPGAAASSAPKVVIIVGPVGGTTAEYKADSDEAAAAALKYTPNVVKLYSPTATWDVVKPALQGASIVIYMGHGNGFPSPYASTLQPDREDGLGLNPTAGTDDTTTKYWGEQYLKSDVHLAPNAVVLLGHLCYASGSSEPGKADPTLTMAKQRVDNMAAGWIAAGAQAVIAEAYGGVTAAYVDALFTAHESLGNIWASSYSNQGNAFAFPSTRSPGMTVQMDPDHSSGKYYRAITGDLSLQSDSVVGGSGVPVPVPTPTNPVPTPAPTPTPTNASIGSPTPTPTPKPTPTPTPKPTPTPTPTSTPTPTPTPKATPKPTPSTTPTDDPMIDFTSDGIALTSISAPAVFSPNGDGVLDTFPIRASLSSSATWQLTIKDRAGTVLASTGGAGDNIAFDWDGTSNGAHLPDGTYTYRLSAGDALGGSLDRSARVRIDTAPPTLVPVAGSATSFSPNGDGEADTWTGTYRTGEAATVTAVVRGPSGLVVRNLTGSSSAGSASVTWDGRSDAGSGVADGQYVVVVSAKDTAGNSAPTVASSVTLYRALGRVTVAPTLFYPQDHDKYAGSTRIGFTLVQPATVTWTIANSRGQTVATKDAAVALASGAQSWAWTGLNAAGASVPAGTYTAVLTVTNGTLSTTVRTPLTLAAFVTTVSPTTATRGHSITVTVVSAESLASAPKLTIRQPGVAARTVTMSRVAANTYRVTTRLSSSGSAGKLSLTVSGTDTGHGVNTASTTLTLK